MVSIVMAAGMRVGDLARVPLSFPTYAGILGRLAANATRQLNLAVRWQANGAEDRANYFTVLRRLDLAWLGLSLILDYGRQN